MTSESGKAAEGDSETGSADISAATVLRLPRGVRLREDPVRGKMVLLAPERAVAVDEIATAILKALDGVRSLDAIADDFADQFGAPKDEILKDMLVFAREFLNRRMLEIVR